MQTENHTKLKNSEILGQMMNAYTIFSFTDIFLQKCDILLSQFDKNLTTSDDIFQLPFTKYIITFCGQHEPEINIESGIH